MITYVVLDLFVPCFQKVSAPDHLGEDLIHSYQFSFRGTFGVQLLFAGLRVGCSLANGHGSSSVTLRVIVNGEGGINMPLHLAGFIHCKNQW